MHVEELAIPDIKLITPEKYGDSRGFFSEIFSRRDFESAGISFQPVQENYSYSAAKFTIRGLHWQSPPHSQGKLIHVLQGKILDVAVDLRLNSPWFGQHVSSELSAENWQQLLIPPGFAHGFCTLEPDTGVLYTVDDFYSAEHETGMRWDDPDIGINWPVTAEQAALSDRDKQLPALTDCDLQFVYEEQPS